MPIATEQSAVSFTDIVADTPLNANFPLYAEDELEVIYGAQALVAVLNEDYTVQLSAPNYDSFTVTPLDSLLTKINALIADPPTDDTEENYVTVRRKLDFKTAASTDNVKYSTFLARELERVHMRLIQLNEALQLKVGLKRSNIGGDATPLFIDKEIPAGSALIVNETGDGITAGPDLSDVDALVETVEDAAEAAELSAQDAANHAAKFIGTSVSSVAIGTGPKVFATQEGKYFNGNLVIVAAVADPTNYVFGVATYSGTTLTVAVEAVGGAGTFANWTISVCGARGPKGDTGAAGSPGAGSGDVVTSGSVVDNEAAIFDGDTGNILKGRGFALGGLAALNTVNNANWSGTDLSVGNGGTGRSTLTQYAVLLGNGTSGLNSTGPGTSGHVLTSNGAGADPTFQAPAAQALKHCVVSNTVNYALTSANWTLLTWDTDVADADNMHNPSSNTSRITVPSDGLYLVTGTVDTTETDNGDVSLAIAINGTRKYYQEFEVGTTNLGVSLNMSMPIKLTAGDYLELYFLKGSGSDNFLAASSQFSVVKLA